MLAITGGVSWNILIGEEAFFMCYYSVHCFVHALLY